LAEPSAKAASALPWRLRPDCRRPNRNAYEFAVTTEQITACRDPKDNHVLETAIDGHAPCILSGDNDLLVLNPFRDIPILGPSQFLSLYPPIMNAQPSPSWSPALCSGGEGRIALARFNVARWSRLAVARGSVRGKQDIGPHSTRVRAGHSRPARPGHHARHSSRYAQRKTNGRRKSI